MFDIGFWELVVITALALLLGQERLPSAIRTTHWIRLIRSTANSVKAELELEQEHKHKQQELHNDLKKAEQLQINNLSSELQESIEQLKAAQSVNRPYQIENEICPPVAEPVAPVELVAQVVQVNDEVSPVNSQQEHEVVNEPVRKGEVEGMSQAEQPLSGHLVELRTTLLRSVKAILLVFLALIYFSNNIYDFVAQPLLRQL